MFWGAGHRDLLERIGGWLGVMPAGEERRADFDQRLLAALALAEPAGDALWYIPGFSYIYGWGRANHCSGLMKTPADRQWYDHYSISISMPIDKLTPEFDMETDRLITTLS